MQVRQTLGLPIVFDPAQEKNLPPEVNQKLEEGMLDACRIVGGHLFKAGKPGEGWMYLQPVGDRAFTAELLRGVEFSEANEETTEQIIDIALGQGVDPEYGFRLMLRAARSLQRDHNNRCKDWPRRTECSNVRRRLRSSLRTFPCRLVRQSHRRCRPTRRGDRW